MTSSYKISGKAVVGKQRKPLKALIHFSLSMEGMRNLWRSKLIYAQFIDQLMCIETHFDERIFSQYIISEMGVRWC